MKVVVTGSLGHISQPLAKELIQKGHSVTVISSKPEKQKDIEALGATAAIGSLENADFLASVFSGADAAYLMVPPDFNLTDQRAHYRTIGNAYAQAIQQSGLRRLVHLSSIGAHLAEGTGFILGSHDTENILNKLPDIAITHLRPGYFYYNLLNFAGMIKAQGFIGANYGDNDKIVMAAPADIAAAAAEEITTITAGKKIRYVTSSDCTCNEIAQILGTAIGKPALKWVTISSEEMQKGMEQRGVPAHLVDNFIELGASLHNGKLREDYDQQKPSVTGKVKLIDFAKEFAAAF